MSDKEQFGELRLTRSKLYESDSVLQIHKDKYPIKIAPML